MYKNNSYYETVYNEFLAGPGYEHCPYGTQTQLYRVGSTYENACVFG